MKAGKRSYGRDGRPKDMRQKVMLLLIPVLAIVLWRLVREPLQAVPVQASETVENQAAVAPAVEEIEIHWERPPVYQPTARDPMQLVPSAVATEEPTPTWTRERVNLVLQGILYSEDRPMAMIGTNLVREGEQIAGVTVVKINPDRVEFEMDGQRWEQTVSEPAVPYRQDREAEEQDTAPDRAQGNNDETPH